MQEVVGGVFVRFRAAANGGISSAITRSLRDYLLPENLGVRKAFKIWKVRYVKTA